MKQINEDDITRVKQFFRRRPKAHIRLASDQLGMSFGKIWTILRKNLNWKPYRPHLGQILSQANMDSRLAACRFWISFPEAWFEKVLWSDEKWFVLNQSPNRKNEVIWAPENPNTVVQCKKAHGAKVMAWVGMIDGKVLPVHWFVGSVDGPAYLDMLRRIVWPAVKGLATRRNYYFQQDGASPHVTEEVMEFLRSKFGDRIISRKSEHHWPPYSPDLNPLDFSFWSQAMAHVTRVEPTNIRDLKMCVEDFAINFEEEKARSLARHTRYRAELCFSVGGGHFEQLDKKKRQ